MSKEVSGHVEEIDLWEKVKKGDLAAFNQIYQIYYPKLIFIAGQLHCSEDIAKDLIHDTFVEIYERRQSIIIKSSLKFYLIRCFKSHWHKYLENSKKHLKVVEEQQYDNQFAFSIQQEIIQKQASLEMYTQLELAINQLSSRQREAMYYFYKEGLDYDEIGEIMSLKTRRSAQNLIYEAVRIIKAKVLIVLLVYGYFSVDETCDLLDILSE